MPPRKVTSCWPMSSPSSVVFRRQVAQRGFSLHADEGLELVHLEHGARGVGHARQTTAAPISTGLPRRSLTFNVGVFRLRAPQRQPLCA